ncbi:tetratricopeptide repeat protein [Pararhodospirillum oryzae]|uniref:Uncharacterized protein n=1 Tax=Pararhodospirillum oryzae TaxID=478448 RepID=A0A512HBN3_9PROT|nr:tetratricopeptide repeat protein [Pararhodospirillum oryzae]GEO82845.1 hypothetical protein ROR02_29760 [Pararhodospirillum oryzae]
MSRPPWPALVLVALLGTNAPLQEARATPPDALAPPPAASGAEDDEETLIPLDPSALRGLTPEMDLPDTGSAPPPAPPPEVVVTGGRGAMAAEEGYRALGAGQVARALEAYTRATRQDPALADAHLGRGAALDLLGRPREAALAYDRALALRPTDPLTRARLTGALSRLPPSESLDRLEALAAQWPADPALWDAVGLQRLRAGRPQPALEALEQATLLAPGVAERQLNLAIAADRADRAARAVIAYRRALLLWRTTGAPPGVDLAAIARRARWLETHPPPAFPFAPAATPPSPSPSSSPP